MRSSARRAWRAALGFLLPAGFLAAAALPAGAQAHPRAAAARAIVDGFAPERLKRIDSVLQRYVDQGRIAGVVGLVLRDGKVAYQVAVGWADREAKRPMTADAIFRIASQSKAITSAAALSLVEEGRIGLGDPVSRWIPTFAHTTVATRTDTGVVLVPARRQIVIRDLLTHTAGVSYGSEPALAPLYAPKGLGSARGAYAWYTADKDEPVCDTMDRLGTLPMAQQPGSAWVYGYSLDILGCVVERAAGEPLDRFIEERITGPLGMRDTRFFLPKDQRSRLAAVYTLDSTGHAVRAPDGPMGQGDYVDGPRRNFAGGAGLLSTARDYARFLETIRNGGVSNGVRVLAPHTVALMTTNQVGALYRTDGTRGFGLGFETTERYGGTGMASVGSFGWGGAYGTGYRVDPKERLVWVLMLQMAPYMDDGIHDAFETAVYQALVGSVTN